MSGGAADSSEQGPRPPYIVLALATAADWDSLEDLYRREPARAAREPAKNHDRPLQRCLEVARDSGARTAVIETEYVDRDYLSEFTSFYALAFKNHPSTTDRIHFFGAEISDAELHALPADPMYLGYVCIRPAGLSPIGRTVLQPPPELRGAVRTAVSDPVTFCGQRLVAVGAPFVQQDKGLGRCAQAATWMCHYSASRHRSLDVARHLLAEFSTAADRELSAGRSVPSDGLSVEQMSSLLEKFGLPPVHYSVDTLNDRDRPQPWLAEDEDLRIRERITRVCCRYLNSGLPVLVAAAVVQGDSTEEDPVVVGMHAQVVCGYSRVGTDRGVRLVVHDDSKGPYRVVTDPLNDRDDLDERQSLVWHRLLAPVPQKLWLSADSAERVGWIQLAQASRQAVADGFEHAGEIARLFVHDDDQDRKVTVRTYAATANGFKRGLADRFDDPEIVREYRRARMPRFVWIVEAVDRSQRTRPDGKCVMGEVIIDATSDDDAPNVLAVRLPGLLDIRGTPNAVRTTASLVRSGAEHEP